MSNALPINQIITGDNFCGPMCLKPYPNHRHGCPNYGKKEGCPPNHERFQDVFTGDIHVMWTRFDLKRHVVRMDRKHPTWTKRQLYCCLFWQSTARKNLRNVIAQFLREHPYHVVTTCPESMGVNVTATMQANFAIDLEWPVETVAYQVAIAGLPVKESRKGQGALFGGKAE